MFTMNTRLNFVAKLLHHLWHFIFVCSDGDYDGILYHCVLFSYDQTLQELYLINFTKSFLKITRSAKLKQTLWNNRVQCEVFQAHLCSAQCCIYITSRLQRCQKFWRCDWYSFVYLTSNMVSVTQNTCWWNIDCKLLLHSLNFHYRVLQWWLFIMCIIFFIIILQLRSKPLKATF